MYLKSFTSKFFKSNKRSENLNDNVVKNENIRLDTTLYKVYYLIIQEEINVVRHRILLIVLYE